MKHHAFLIVAHSFPEQLEDIVNLLDASNHSFFVKVDKKNEKMLFTDAVLRRKEKQNVRLIRSMRVNRGGFSQVTCTLKLLKEAFKISSPEKIDYFHLISGQDFPCKSNDEIDALFEHGEKSYMHFDSPEETMEWRKHKYPNRTDYFDFRDLHFPYFSDKMLKSLIRVTNKVANIYKRKPITDVYAGWNWFSWHRSVVDYVLSFVEDNPCFVKRFKRTVAADELFFHTMLFNKADELKIEKYKALRFIEWHPKRDSKSLPLILDEREYEEIIESDAIFCRKVHPVHSAKLIHNIKKNISST